MSFIEEGWEMEWGPTTAGERPDGLRARKCP